MFRFILCFAVPYANNNVSLSFIMALFQLPLFPLFPLISLIALEAWKHFESSLLFSSVHTLSKVIPPLAFFHFSSKRLHNDNYRFSLAASGGQLPQHNCNINSLTIKTFRTREREMILTDKILLLSGHQTYDPRPFTALFFGGQTHFLIFPSSTLIELLGPFIRRFRV